ncbi:DUF6630 family protein [uncultured Spirosoma sp.]|uniref:DUF6630 family protein n=1 Tax=uncultured Spirosoma sp. TaxID=278208 RepID=UPI0025885D7C|nr:DUF6630 family protein [uncultured Spirosoma sp.]
MLAQLFTSFFKSKPVDLALPNKMIDLIAVSEKVRNELKVKLGQAVSNPKSFYDFKGNFYLSDRGLTYPKDADKTAKFVFVDTLIENGQMAEVDWKEEEAEMRFAINQILRAKHYDFIVSQDTVFVDGEDTLDMITQINDKELALAGYSLQSVDINSDSYVFTIVPISQAEEVRQLLMKF